MVSAGPWLFRDAEDENCVILESTQWPGLFFWHSVDTVQHGRCYFGRGDKNIDTAFILGNPEDQDWVVDIGIVPDYDWKAPPMAAIAAADDWFTQEEARLEKLLPPLPEPKKPSLKTGGEAAEGNEGETTDDPSSGDENSEEQTASGEPTTVETTDVSDQEEGEEAKWFFTQLIDWLVYAEQLFLLGFLSFYKRKC